MDHSYIILVLGDLLIITKIDKNGKTNDTYGMLLTEPCSKMQGQEMKVIPGLQAEIF